MRTPEQQERIDDLVLRGIRERQAEANGGRPPYWTLSKRERAVWYPEYSRR